MDTWTNDPADPDDPPCSVGSVVATSPGFIRSVPATCRRWSCPNCGRLKARRLAERIGATPATRFVTLTARAQPGVPPEEILDELNNAWRALWKRLQRLHGERAEGYVKVVELTAAGTPHLHLGLAIPYTSQRWLSAQWSELTGYRIVDIRRIHSDASLGRYLAKYLTKTHNLVSSRRKWSASTGFLPQLSTETVDPSGVPVTWSFTMDTMTGALARLADYGWSHVEGWWQAPPQGGSGSRSSPETSVPDSQAAPLFMLS